MRGRFTPLETSLISVNINIMTNLKTSYGF